MYEISLFVRFAKFLVSLNAKIFSQIKKTQKKFVTPNQYLRLHLLNQLFQLRMSNPQKPLI